MIKQWLSFPFTLTIWNDVDSRHHEKDRMMFSAAINSKERSVVDKFEVPSRQMTGVR